jgi:MoaA/NifB/PqqE/SkfB family radical SAM enzyme
MMHALIASPYMGSFLLVRPGHRNGVTLPESSYDQLVSAAESGQEPPPWLIETSRRAWPDLDITGRPLRQSVLARPRSPFGFARASYELNLGCNYDCPVCYLGVKKFSGLSWDDRIRLLHVMRDAGVLWLQLTGGEPLIDKLFPDVYGMAFELGMMLSVSTNGSRLSSPVILDLLSARRPYRLTVSVYGACEQTYDAVTRRRGSFRAFSRGLAAAHDVGLPLHLNIIVVKQNAHEIEQMTAMATGLGVPHMIYSNISPTIYGGPESLPAQSVEHLRKRKPFTGCNAGHTFFHADPHGMASICKVGRDPQISLMDEGLEGLARLGGIADGLLLRQGGCSGCSLSGSCGTCMPLVTLYRKAKAPLASYCQHGRR